MLLCSSGPPFLAVCETEHTVAVRASTPPRLTSHPLADVNSLRAAWQQEVSPQQPALQLQCRQLDDLTAFCFLPPLFAPLLPRSAHSHHT